MKRTRPSTAQTGTTLLEVLVTIVIVAFGLLGIAAFQAKAQVGSIESYQRAQAVILLQDMSERLTGNSDNAASYVTSTPIGTSDSQPDSCADTAAGAAHDICEWSHALKGAGETDSGGTQVGAMVGARGCVQMVQTPNTTAGVCQPAIYDGQKLATR